MAKVTELHVNGKALRVDADSERTLLSVLRDDLDLTGGKYGCGEGQCGACTVWLNGFPARSCHTSVGDAAQKKITTIEGLEKDGRLHPMQKAFLEAGVEHSVYSTSGTTRAATALLRRNPYPTDVETVRFMEGNVCRCGTYRRIITAIQQAAKTMKGGTR